MSLKLLLMPDLRLQLVQSCGSMIGARESGALATYGRVVVRGDSVFNSNWAAIDQRLQGRMFLLSTILRLRPEAIQAVWLCVL